MIRLATATVLARWFLPAALLVAAAPLRGQLATTPANPWDGPAAIGVEVKDQSGKAVPGARVTVRFTALQPPAGPPTVVTDAKGQAVAGHLAEGSWYVEVSHPQAMLFTAYVDTKAGKAAKSTFAAQVSTGTSWSPLRVDFFKVKSMPPAVPAVAPATATAAAPAPPGPAPVAPVVPVLPASPAPVATPSSPPAAQPTPAPVASPPPATLPTPAPAPRPAPAPAATPAPAA
ncbi:MAG TPA: carboxypeptidase-like regulatory domain-containing protein, partial [Thermoanaerobaculia bacterium]|nr:carboxypeptidase-like regulatory domain-containing protein [Thermoanaerobaculia bacterium]